MQASGALCRMIEHLLKMKYCTNDRNYMHWNDKREIIWDLTGWDMKKPYINLIKYLHNNLKDTYEVGIKLYQKDTKKFDDFKIVYYVYQKNVHGAWMILD